MRSVVIHYHLFKNAGSTIDSILRNNFPGDSHGHIEGHYPWSTISDKDVLDYVRANSQLHAISSHQARLPLPVHPNIKFLPIIFLRHPIDRLASVYEFERKQPETDLSPSVLIARNGGLAEFANWAVERHATAVCRNFQVTHLAGTQIDMREARATHEDYLKALMRLKELPFFGLVERFDESLESMQNLMRPHIGELDLNFTIQNFSAGRQARLEDRLAYIERELGPQLYRELLEHNSLDLLLYREAQLIFAERRAARTTARARPKRLRERFTQILRS